MGKPYTAELQQLENTFTAMMEMDISALKEFVTSASTLPLYVVGSGGSLSAAHLIAYMHQRLANQFAKAITPLEAVDLVVPSQSWFWFLSAGGRNVDINDAFKEIVLKEPKHLCVTCARTGSPLARYARRYMYTDVFDFNLPSGRDGFLATNSLLAFVLLAFRAYQCVFLREEFTPQNILELLKHNGSMTSFFYGLRDLCAPLWERDTLLVLFGPSTQPAAFDLESKFAEAALGHVLLSDYRNFAHGRHHWLAKRRNISAVLAFSTDREKQIANKTIALLPQDVPVVHIDFSDQGIYAPVAALTTVLYIVGFAGEARAIDPGRPGVPEFGRKIYHLRGLRGMKQTHNADLVVRRKVQHFLEPSEGYLRNLKEGSHKFIRELQQKAFSAVLFDYDGTLCAPKDRFIGTDPNVAKELVRLLEAGIPVGIATGRGKSVRTSLRQEIPKTLWQRIIIGYYNGAECGYLLDEMIPDGTDKVCPDLAQVESVLLRNRELRCITTITARKYQITVETSHPVYLDTIWALVNALIQQCGMPGIKVVASGHSVDILAPAISKTRVIEAVIQEFGIDSDSAILCIGDMGAWPGNDYELLHRPCSLSVDQVSLDSKFCWNLAPAGYRGIQATLFYFKCMNAQNSMITFKLRPTKGADIR